MIHNVKSMLSFASKMGQDSVKNYNLWANGCSKTISAGGVEN